MRTIARILNPIGFVAAVFVGVTAILINQQLDAVQAKADPDAQQVTAADLVRNGPGKNAHLVVSDFRLGAPIVEKEERGWQRVAVPVVPAKEKVEKPAYQLILRVDIEGEADLESLRQQTAFHVLAATSLSPKSAWGQATKVTLPKPEAKKDAKKELATTEPVKTIVLVVPGLKLAGAEVLTTERLFDRELGGILWAIAAGGFTLALVCVWSAWSLKGPPSRLSPALESAHDGLGAQFPLSVHQFQYWAYFMHSWQFYVAPIFLLFALVGISVSFDHLLDPTSPTGASSVVFPIIALLLCWGCLAWVFRNRWYSPAEVQVCSGGIRIREGNTWHGILWSDVKSVQRGEVANYRAGQLQNHSGQTVLTLHDGRTIWLLANRYSGYFQLANQVQTAVGEVTARQKGSELASTGIVDFGCLAVGPAGVVLKGGLLFGDRLLEWDDIEAFEVVNGHLLIYRRNYWFFRSISLPLSAIPDYLALLALLKTGAAQPSVVDPLKIAIPAPKKPTAAS